MFVHIRKSIAVALPAILACTVVAAGAHPCGTAPPRPSTSALVHLELNPQPEPPGSAVEPRR